MAEHIQPDKVGQMTVQTAQGPWLASWHRGGVYIDIRHVELFTPVDCVHVDESERQPRDHRAAEFMVAKRLSTWVEDCGEAFTIELPYLFRYDTTEGSES